MLILCFLWSFSVMCTLTGVSTVTLYRLLVFSDCDSPISITLSWYGATYGTLFGHC